MATHPDVEPLPTWRKLYEAAVLEFDPKLLPDRIAAALMAIENELKKPVDATDARQPLINALSALADLRDVHAASKKQD